MQTDINTDFVCHLSIIPISSGQDVVTAESAATTTKLYFVNKKEEERGRFLEPGELPPQVAVGTKFHRISFTHSSLFHQCQRKTETCWLNTTNHINQNYSAFGHSILVHICLLQNVTHGEKH